MPHTFKLSDESINTYGFWVKTAGIDLAQFRKNPVMLYDHERYGQMPIGKWTNIRVENNELLADAEFDADDDFAQKVASKVEKGYLTGVSIGFEPLEMSESKKHLKKGQTRPTVIQSKLIEASITAFPSNDNALKLKKNGKTVNLSDSESDINQVIPYLKLNQMKEVNKLLGLNEDAQPERTAEAVKNLKNKLSELEADRVKKLLESEAVNDENKKHIEALAEQNFELARKTIELLEKKSKKEQSRLSDFLERDHSGADEDETFDSLQKNNPERLAYLKANEPETFKKLINNHLKRK